LFNNSNAMKRYRTLKKQRNGYIGEDFLTTWIYAIERT
jgi:hypothetical protein